MYEDLPLENDPRLEELSDRLEEVYAQDEKTFGFYCIALKRHWAKDENGNPYFVNEFAILDTTYSSEEKMGLIESVIKEDGELADLKMKKHFFVN